MKNSIESIRESFDNKMDKIKISVGGDLSRMREEFSSINNKLQSFQ